MFYYFKYKKLMRDYELLKQKYKDKCRECEGLFNSLLKNKRKVVK